MALDASSGSTLPLGQDVRGLTKRLNDGTVMPVVGLGTWKSPKGEVEAAVRHALCHAGYRHIDAAQIYNNQEEVGRGISYALENCNLTREELWVTSKIWPVDFHPLHVQAAVDRILSELGLAFIDQILLHWPTPYKKPPEGCPPACSGTEFAGTDDAMRPRSADGNMVASDVPISSTWAALERVRMRGQVRSIGVSNFNPEEIDSLMGSVHSIVPAVNQVEAHVFWNQARLRSAMKNRSIVLVAYSPLGNPALYGDKVEGMKSSLVAGIASEAGLTPAQVMLNFLIALGDVVVPKSVTLGRIDSNIGFNASLNNLQMSRLMREAPQKRLANPRNRPGGRAVFDDESLRNEL